MTMNLAPRRIAFGLAAFVPIAVALVTPASELAEAEQKGLDIALEARAKKVGFENFTASQVMVLRNKQGRESRRALRVKVMEVEDDGDRSLFVFDEPRDVQGTAFLIHGHKDKADDQWLYLPALKRVKRISSANRSGSFMGSEFAYEDMSPPEVERFTYRYLREEPCGELTCTVVERMPVDAKSGYSRQVVWQDTEELRLWKSRVLRPQERTPENADHRRLRTLPGSLLAGEQHEHGQSPDREEHRPDLDRLPVSNGPRCHGIHADRLETRPLDGSRHRRGRRTGDRCPRLARHCTAAGADSL